MRAIINYVNPWTIVAHIIIITFAGALVRACMHFRLIAPSSWVFPLVQRVGPLLHGGTTMSPFQTARRSHTLVGAEGMDPLRRVRFVSLMLSPCKVVYIEVYARLEFTWGLTDRLVAARAQNLDSPPC